MDPQEYLETRSGNTAKGPLGTLLTDKKCKTKEKTRDVALLSCNIILTFYFPLLLLLYLFPSKK